MRLKKSNTVPKRRNTFFQKNNLSNIQTTIIIFLICVIYGQKIRCKDYTQMKKIEKERNRRGCMLSDLTR
jgi:hypothetical protein